MARSENAEEKRLRQAVEYAESHMDEEPGPRVAATVAKTPRHVFSLKMGAAELDEVTDAADVEGTSVGAFIRNAALKEARRVMQNRQRLVGEWRRWLKNSTVSRYHPDMTDDEVAALATKIIDSLTGLPAKP